MEFYRLAFLAIIFISLSAICSGLNISLMSLDLSDLRRRARSGDIKARLVLPLRRNSHLSLAAILLGNVGMAAATSLILEARLGGWVAGVTSTLLLVTFGEILPQAIFVRNALTITAFFAPFMRILILVTYPIAKPLQLLLDKLFGKHLPRLHSRLELGMIITEHLDHDESELDEDEVEIMKGALALSDKRVRDIMTDIRHVYWLTPETILDGKKIDEIKEENWSRVPIFNKDRTELHGILLMKDMVDIDFNARSYKVSELRIRPAKAVGSMTALDTMFRKFIAAHSHLMPVEKNGVFIGIVTIEDLIEEIIGHEIEDESDQTR